MIPEQRLQDFIQQNRMTDGEEFIDRLSQAILDGSLSSPPPVVEGGPFPMETAPKKGGARILVESCGEVMEAHYLDNSGTEYPWQGWLPANNQVPINTFKPVQWWPLPSPTAKQADGGGA